MTKKPLYIGLGHYKRTGKDSFANFLVAALASVAPDVRVKKLSFAWKLKDVCHQLYGWAGLQGPEFYETEEGGALREIVLPAIGKSPRQIWIDFGTPAVREQVYENTWIDYVFQVEHDADVILVPDVRFDNEAAEIKKRNGLMVKVVRPGYGPGPNLPDRKLLGYEDWDYVIGDAGTMESLNAWAHEFAYWIAGSATRPRQTQHQLYKALSVEKVEPWDGAPVKESANWVSSVTLTPGLAQALLDVEQATDCMCFDRSAPESNAQFKGLLEQVRLGYPGLKGEPRKSCSRIPTPSDN